MKLSLFFTEGVSLKTWDTVGMLERELALYRELINKQVEVMFVTYGGKEDLSYQERLPGLSFRVNQHGRPLEVYERELVNDPPQVDVIKSNQMAGADIALGAARKAGAKFIARCGYLLADFQEKKYGIRSREAKTARKLEKRVFESADASVVTTPRMAAEVISRYGLNANQVRVIPNYVETNRFIPTEREANKLLRVAFVGRLDKQKNLRTLVRAVSGFEVEVWLIGYGPQREELENLAQNAKAKFRFLGNVQNRELPMLLSQCDMFVLPSLYEGHPKALLEAMACGLPSVGTDVSGIQDVIRNEETGLLCGLEIDDLRNALGRLIGDEALRAKLGRAGRAYVVEQFALERVVEIEFSLLEQLAT